MLGGTDGKKPCCEIGPTVGRVDAQSEQVAPAVVRWRAGDREPNDPDIGGGCGHDRAITDGRQDQTVGHRRIGRGD